MAPAAMKPMPPCTVEDLRRFGYDYWALGHIHAAEIVARDPWIVYPGNIPGRSVREMGPKGAVRVTVEDGRIVEVTPLVLDAARWVHETLDVSACLGEADALSLIQEALARLHPEAGGRPLAIRFTLSGTTPAHARLVARARDAGGRGPSAGLPIRRGLLGRADKDRHNGTGGAVPGH